MRGCYLWLNFHREVKLANQYVFTQKHVLKLIDFIGILLAHWNLSNSYMGFHLTNTLGH